jgi:hypothetical protein
MSLALTVAEGDLFASFANGTVAGKVTRLTV